MTHRLLVLYCRMRVREVLYCCVLRFLSCDFLTRNVACLQVDGSRSY